MVKGRPQKCEISKEFLLEELKTKTPKQISEYFGYHVASIHRKIKKFGIQRSRHNHLINHDYFKNWSNKMSYILGFIFADGNVYDNRKYNRSYTTISLNNKDKDILQFITSEIYPTLKILDYDRVDKKTKKIFKISTVTLCSKILYNDLVNFGCVPNKSYKEIRMPSIPKEYIRDFIRGYFDGDGSVSYGYGKKDIKKLNISAKISCSSVSFLEDILKEIGVGKINTIENPASLNFYSINDIKTLFNYIYNGNFYMKRKYNKFINIFKLRNCDEL